MWFSRPVILLLVGSLVVGQLGRLPLPGQGGGLLLSDLAVVLVLLAAVMRKLYKHPKLSKLIKRPVWKVWYVWSVWMFIIWSAFTLVIHLPGLGLPAGLIAGAYWLRLTTHLLLFPALLVLLTDQRLRIFTRRSLLVAIGLLVGLGFLQIMLMPNLNLSGWDPHQGRLVSTWLDPNLFGGFLILAFLFALPQLLMTPLVALGDHLPLVRGGKLTLLFLSLFALFLTQSRTSFIALAGSILLLSPLLIAYYLASPLSPQKIVRLISIAGIAAAGILVAGLALGERAWGLFSLDATAQARLASWRQAWVLIRDHPWAGVGYNAYQFALQAAGFGGDFTIHSRAGADNSWLTIWATTGIIGLTFFAIPWLVVIRQLLWGWLKQKKASHAAALISLVALFIHSQFVNSFLYSHLLISLSLFLALAFSEHD